VVGDSFFVERWGTGREAGPLRLRDPPRGRYAVVFTDAELRGGYSDRNSAEASKTFSKPSFRE